MPYQAVNTLQIDGDVTIFAIRYEGGTSGYLPNEAYEVQAHAGMAHVSFLLLFFEFFLLYLSVSQCQHCRVCLLLVLTLLLAFCVLGYSLCFTKPMTKQSLSQFSQMIPMPQVTNYASEKDFKYYVVFTCCFDVLTII